QVGTTTTTAAGGSFVCRFPDGPASSTVSVQVKDSDNALSNTATQTVTVNNVASTVALSAANDLSVDEGSQHTYSFSVSDPGVDSPTVTESCGLSATCVADATANSFRCTFPDGPASTVVNVTADDGDPSANIGQDRQSTRLNTSPP